MFKFFLRHTRLGIEGGAFAVKNSAEFVCDSVVDYASDIITDYQKYQINCVRNKNRLVECEIAKRVDERNLNRFKKEIFQLMNELDEQVESINQSCFSFLYRNSCSRLQAAKVALEELADCPDLLAMKNAASAQAQIIKQARLPQIDNFLKKLAAVACRELAFNQIRLK